jgi:NADH-quinone oxidoreductase subunit N
VYEGAGTIITTYFAVVPKIAYLGVLMKMGGGELVILGGVLSIIVGSLGAINQTKVKRMLAYSAIGHVGFMLIGVGVATYTSIQATLVYMIIYIVMTVNSFAIIRNQGIQKIAELRGLSRRNGVLGMTMGLGLMSIAGVPPLAGFYNKYLVLTSAVEAGQVVVAVIAVLLSVISGFYYVRLIRYMYFKDRAEITVVTPRVGVRTGIVLGVTTYLIMTIMINPSILMEITIPGIY